MSNAKTEDFTFVRETGWYFVGYFVEIPRSQVVENVELNPGTIRVEDAAGNVVWRPQ